MRGVCGPRWRSCYSDSLRVGWSGDRISVRARFSVPLHTGPGAPPCLLHNGLRLSFPGVKQPERGVDHLPPSIAEIEERVELYLWVFKACPRVKFHDRFYPSCWFIYLFTHIFGYVASNDKMICE